MMKNLKLKTLIFAAGLALSASAMAESMSKKQYKALEKIIDTDYAVAMKSCDSLAENANDICEAEAKGIGKTSKARLEYDYKPTGKNLYKARLAKADAEYSIAIEKCDDTDGNVKDVCAKEAEAAKTQQTAAAEAQMKASKADAKAIEEASEARKDAESDMLDANYEVEKEKCDALSNKAKDRCLSDAKSRFAK
jgi:hypothetical protein